MIITYSAITTDGTVVRKRGEFRRIHELLDSVASEGLILLDYSKDNAFNRDKLSDMLLPAIKRVDIIEFCESMSSMLEGGLPLLESLETLRDTTRVKRLRKALDMVISDISGGESFSGALAVHPNVFPDIMVFLTRIGEETGNLQGTLKDTAYHLKRVDDIVSNTKRALAYPIFVFISMTAVLFFWILYVLPKLASVFKDMNLELPLITRTVMSVSAAMRTYWYTMPLALVACIVAFVLARKNSNTRLVLDRIGYRLPVAGRVAKASSLAIFFAYMSMMLGSGLTLTRSFEVMEKTFRNLALREVVGRIKDMTSSGFSLFDACKNTRFFDLFALQIIKVGETTGRLDDRLKYLADTYQEKLERLVDMVGKMLEPMVLGIAGGLFIFIIISLIGPVYDLISKVGG